MNIRYRVTNLEGKGCKKKYGEKDIPSAIHYRAMNILPACLACVWVPANVTRPPAFLPKSPMDGVGRGGGKARPFSINIFSHRVISADEYTHTLGLKINSYTLVSSKRNHI